MEQIKVKLNFYGESIEINLEPKYEEFLSSLLNILSVNPEGIENIKFSYLDIDQDCIEFSNEREYNDLLNQIRRGEVNSITAKLTDMNVVNPKSQNNFQKKESKDSLSNLPLEGFLEEKNNFHDFPKNPQIPLNIQQNQFIPSEFPLLNQEKYIQNWNKNQQFNVTCNNCKESPLFDIIYFCPRCGLYSCSKCEEEFTKHNTHALLKIKTQEILEDAIRIHYSIKSFNPYNFPIPQMPMFPFMVPRKIMNNQPDINPYFNPYQKR